MRMNINVRGCFVQGFNRGNNISDRKTRSAAYVCKGIG